MTKTPTRLSVTSEPSVPPPLELGKVPLISQGVTSTVLTISLQWGTGGSERGGRYTAGPVGGSSTMKSKKKTLMKMR